MLFCSLLLFIIYMSLGLMFTSYIVWSVFFDKENSVRPEEFGWKDIPVFFLFWFGWLYIVYMMYQDDKAFKEHEEYRKRLEAEHNSARGPDDK